MCTCAPLCSPISGKHSCVDLYIGRSKEWVERVCECRLAQCIRELLLQCICTYTVNYLSALTVSDIM